MSYSPKRNNLPWWFPAKNTHALTDYFETNTLADYTLSSTVSGSAIDPDATFSSGGPRVSFTGAGLQVQPEIDVTWTITKPTTFATNVFVMVLFTAGGRETQNIQNHQAGLSAIVFSENATQTGHYAHTTTQVVTAATYYMPTMIINHTAGTVKKEADDNGFTDCREFAATQYAAVAMQKISNNYHGYAITHAGNWFNMGVTAYSGNTLDNFIIPFYSVDDVAAFRRGNPIHTIRAIYTVDAIVVPGSMK